MLQLHLDLKIVSGEILINSDQVSLVLHSEIVSSLGILIVTLAGTLLILLVQFTCNTHYTNKNNSDIPEGVLFSEK